MLCRIRTTCFALASLLMASGCSAGDDAGSSADRPTVVATTSIWADVVGNVACAGAVEVQSLVPVGGDPHGFEASLADRARMETASLVVANGFGLEERLDDTLAAVEDAGVPVVAMADLVESPRSEDPHVWFDPVRVAGALPTLADRLVDDAGLDPDSVGACLDDYVGELTMLDAGIADLFSAVPPDRRTLVTNHDALGYFADRYGLDIVGTVIPSPSALAETSPAQLEELSETIEREGVTAIFAEQEHSSDDAEALAARVGDIEVVTLFTGSLAGPGSGATSYVELLETDAQLIAGALGRR